jgi:probable F420-dependent oxidoreductase
MTKIKIGVQIRPQHTTWEAYRDAWLWADEAGIDVIYNWDHFFPLFGTQPDNPYQNIHFEAWTLQAALGAQTKRAQISCLVHCMSYRNAALMSNMAKTLDHVTNGRYVLGIGAGWAQRDYDEFGYEFGTPGTRLKAFERGLAIIRERWEKDPPKPVNGTIPILIGGGGEKVTLRIAAQYADQWHTHGAPDAWARKSAILDEWCAKVGRDPKAIERVCAARPEQFNVLDEYVKLGATQLIYGWDHPWDKGELQELLAWRDRASATR